MSNQPTSYDEVPYSSHAFPHTHPDRLAAVGRIFGLSAPDVATCRVLELGCASGGNLIPMASHLPHATFLGIDASRRQVDDGRRVAAALGLSNIRIEHASILDVDCGWGEFDYILCHGVFSWVEAPVQDQILRILREHLHESGIGYVSYNTYPGWHLREAVRHMMRYHARGFDEPAEQVQQARALLAFLASVPAESDPYGLLLRQEVERLRHAADSYLYHEHLEQTNTPLYFHQFMERAARFELQYLSEAAVSDMLTVLLPGPVAATLEEISPDILHLEQYMDFVRNRQFRQTLLCHEHVRPRRALTPGFLGGLFVSSSAVAEQVPPDLAAGTAAVFRKGRQRADVNLPATKAALTILMERWPEAVQVEALCAEAIARAGPHLGATAVEETHRSLMGDLFGSVMYGLVQLHTLPPACTHRVSGRPRAHPLAAFQAGDGQTVVNAHHETHALEPFTAAVLRLLDGSRTHAALVETLLEQEVTGRADPAAEPAPDRRRSRARLARRVDEMLVRLVRAGVLIE